MTPTEEALARMAKPHHYPQHLHFPGGRVKVVLDPLEHEAAWTEEQQRFAEAPPRDPETARRYRGLLQKVKDDLEAAKY